MTTETLESPELSYASYFDDPLKRRLIRTVERMSGQPKIKQLYEHYRDHLARDVPFFEAAMRLLDLDVQFSASRLAEIPRTGPLVIVANHPFGVLDGLVICWLTSLRRMDFKVLTNSALDGVPEARPYILPVDFSGTKAALAANVTMRKEALDHVKAGGCVIVFPGGGVATTPRPFDRTAVDDEWKPFTAKLISHSGAHVTPVYFEGQNSRLFQLASHFSLELRLALVFREVKRRMGTALPVVIGETLTPDALKDAGKRKGLMEFLRAQTYGLAPVSQTLRYDAATRRFMAKKPLVFR
ncbi:MAG: lysophospholipid acyltransferase family protein [Alphaproteobacteria bacterium]|nr:lysophospholipid acyltransferase family protein [Alphaproteobacteria bacterium]MBU2084358.1 lysophospholipid acyltransferase family protein [Alphaproteobacteria bacterium]MBU2143030.1 lysophospholipid acyltransferase family protein [Alphaproteobacteria bacterium]MBU2195900.1 lysophospholipid acyltransferase family protein [Alphaproteobacteria bacterium]